ncbi:hypothetical protein ABIA32_000929 [Streptacidiphilus sp. MAP12-20]|uniref:hypothetical protein n=1 Tax=Streptacidiphilus sp. MAP12-20 TaxID=3156299 RepID=UPI003517A759
MIPAHATFEWRLSIGVAKNWLVNDGKIDILTGYEEQGKTLHPHGGGGPVELTVGDGKNGGPVLVSVAGGTKLSPGHPAWERLTVTNHTGATISEPLKFLPQAFAFAQIGQVDLKLYQWVGATAKAKAHWQDITKSGFTVPAGLADSATASAWFQVRVVSYTAKAPSEQGEIWAYSPQILPTPQAMPSEPVTVLR